MRYCICVLLWIVLAGSAFADTTWVNTPTVSGNWTAANSPYMIQNSVTVPAGDTLSIGPGVTVFFAGNFPLYIDSAAHFSAVGTEQDSVHFTTDTLANPGTWSGISVEPSLDTTDFEYCVIEYVRQPAYAAVNVNTAPLRVRHSTFRFCSTVISADYGSASRSWFDFSDCLFAGNRYTAIGVGYSLLHMTNCLLEDNAAWDYGGGAIDFWGDTLRLENCTFRNNTASGRGGAILIETGAAEITGCTFTGNISGGNGGAIATLSMPSVHVSGCTFADNKASLGGGVNWLGESLVIEQSVFHHDSAAYGGAIYAQSLQSPVIRNCTIVANAAAAHAGGIFCHGVVPALVNTIVGFNTGEGLEFDSPVEQSIHHNLFFGNTLGPVFTLFERDTLGFVSRTNANGDSCDALLNLYLDPVFADSAYHLAPNSPCIDAGDPASPHDPDGTVADIGAYYYPHPSRTGRRLIPYPLSLSLSSWPNPFNPVTEIRYDLPRASCVNLRVFDILGREVAILVDKPMPAGSYALQWNAENLPSGMYFAVLQAGSERMTRKVLLLK